MRNIFLFLVLLLTVSCSKDEADFIMEKSFGSGMAVDAEIASDSTFLIAGQENGSPLFIKTRSGTKIDINYSPDTGGCFDEVLEHSNGYLLAGSTGGNIALYNIDKEGTEVWDTVISVNPYVRTVQLSLFDTDTYLLVGSDHPDSLSSTSFIVAIFDIAGDVLQINEAVPGFRASLTDLEVLSPQEIYVSVTKNFGGGNSKASVARLSPEGSIVWERELYNNNDYMSKSLGIIADNANLYVSGSTQYTAGEGDVSNSFVASVSLGGTVNWKKYLEAGNIGTDMVFDSGMNLLLLNRDCMILSGITLPDAGNTERIRALAECDSYDTETMGMALSLTNDNDYLLAGSKEGKFYYALKSGGAE